MKKLKALILGRKNILTSVILAMIFYQCVREDKSDKYDPSFPLLGDWTGKMSYIIENGDTTKMVKNTERFFVLKNDSVQYSFFGDNNYTTVPYYYKGDTFRIKNTNSIILELDETKLVRKTMISESKYWIFICKRQ